MATIPKPPQISPIHRKVSSGIESDLASLSPLSRKPQVEPLQTYSRKESQNIQHAKIKALLSKKASKNSALAITRHQEGDSEPEIPRMVDYSSTYDLPKEEFNKSKYTIYKKEHSFGDKQYNLFGSVFRDGSTAQNNSFYSRETGYIQDAQQTRFKEQRVQAPDCLEMDMRPGAMFQIAKEASQRSISQGRTGLHIRYQKNTINQRGNSSETTDLGKSFEVVQTFRKSISKERPRPAENKNQIILPRLEKKVTVQVQVQEEVLTNRNNHYLATPISKKAELREISPQSLKNKKDTSNYPADILERRNTTDPGYDETPTSPFIRKIYSRGDNSAFITPRRKNNSTLLAPYEDSSSLQQSPELNQTFDEEYFPLVNKKERLPRAKLSGIELERNRSGFQKDIKDVSGGFQVGTNSYFDAKYSWTKAIGNDIRQKPGYNSKSRNIKGIDHLLRLKTRIGHQEKMREYLRRRGLNENTKVFCFNSKDMHIKRILEGLGWVENPNIDSPLFDLKWAYRDLDNYQLLSEGQFFNHFGNNQALTMKSELMKNLRDNRDYGNEWSFFPRAYELTHEGQIKEFKEDFDRTMIENLIKKLWEYIKGRCDRKMIKNAKVKFWTRQKTEEERKSSNAKKIEEKKFGKESQQKKIKMYRKYARQNIAKTTKVKQQTKWDEISFGEAQRREDFLMHAELVIQTLRCIRTLVKQQKAKVVMEDNDCYAVSDLPKRIQEALLKYSQADHFSTRIIEEIKTAPEVIHSIWKTPNQDIVNLIYKYYSLLKLVFPQFKIDGSKNIWIVKPGGNSKGSGIFLINTLEEALENRTRHQSRIIQKYIERPLILRDFPIPEMNGKKFDLRQWVLVTSVNPLTVYMFSSCYLRICSIDFDLQDLKNSYRHLTNFSVNKQKYGKSAENSVCRVEYLKDYLKYNRNIEWDSYIKPQIINIINKTLACVSDELDQRSGCFELYGFDILLDETCKAWLLEVNLSPACSERVPWLIHMLDQMGLEMLKLVLPANYLGDVGAYMSKERAYNNDDASFEDDDSRHMRWELISKDDAAKETKEIIVNPNIAFEVVGTKLNWKKDYLFDSKHNYYRLMVILQKSIKAFLFRKSIQRRIRNTKAKVIQRRVRRFIARVRYIKRMQLRAFETMKKFIMKSLKAKFFTRFIQTNASVFIQRHVRHRQKYLKQRRNKGLKRLERGLGKYFGRRLICGLIYAKAAVTIQRYVRERQRCRREKREKGFAKLRITLLQHTWKKLVKKVQLEKAAISIQKQFRGWKSRKSYKEKQKEIESNLKDSNTCFEKDEIKNEEYLNVDSQQTSTVSTKSSSTNKEEPELDDNRNC